MSGSGTRIRRRPLGKVPTPGTENPGWAIFSYMISGMIFYGAAGWALGRWVFHTSLAFPIGMVVGLALGIALVIMRYGRSGAA
jgi:ATP synthase protein I